MNAACVSSIHRSITHHQVVHPYHFINGPWMIKCHNRDRHHILLYWLYCTTVLQSKSHFCHVPSYDMCDDWYVIYLVTFLQPLNATSYPTQTRRQLPSHGCSGLLPEMLRLQVQWMGCTHEPFSCYSRPLWLTWHETSKSTPTNLSFQYEDPILDIRAPCQRKRLQQNTLHDHYDPTLDC